MAYPLDMGEHDTPKLPGCNEGVHIAKGFDAPCMHCGATPPAKHPNRLVKVGERYQIKPGAYLFT